MPKASGSPPAPFQGMLEVSYRGTLGASSWNVDHGFITNGGEFFPDPDFDILLGELFAIFAAPCATGRQAWPSGR